MSREIGGVKQISQLSCIFNMKFNILARSSKFKRIQTIRQKIKYNLPNTGRKMTFIPHFYPLLMKTFPWVWLSKSFRGFLNIWKDDWASTFG